MNYQVVGKSIKNDSVEYYVFDAAGTLISYNRDGSHGTQLPFTVAWQLQPNGDPFPGEIPEAIKQRLKKLMDQYTNRQILVA